MNKVLLLLFAFCVTAAAQSPSPDPVTIIRAGVLIDGKSDQPKTNQVIVIRGKRIVSVGSAGSAQSVKADTTIDLSRATVLPGLIDTHTHLFLQGLDPELGGYDVQLLKHGLAYRAARATASARRALEQGFTTIRDLETEGAGYGDVGIKQAVNEGHIPGPRIYAVTRAISTTGGYALEGYAPEIEVPKGAQIVDGPVEARKATREQIEHGADWIKVYMTHRSWLDKNGNLVSQPTLTLEEIKAVTDEAHGQKLKVACHAYNGEGLHRALNGGCDSIEHGLELDDAAIAQMVRQGTWYVPTMSPYYYWWEPEGTPAGNHDRKRAEVHGPSFRKALRAGVKIAFGSDVGGFSWTEPIAQEFGRMVEFGMTPMQAIQSATSRAAEMLDAPGELGVIAPGALADVIAVQGDPARDVNVLKNVRFVMKDGKVFKNELEQNRR